MIRSSTGAFVGKRKSSRFVAAFGDNFGQTCLGWQIGSIHVSVGTTCSSFRRRHMTDPNKMEIRWPSQVAICSFAWYVLALSSLLSFSPPNLPMHYISSSGSAASNHDSMSATNDTSIWHVPQFKYRADVSWIALQNHFDHLRSLQQKCLHPKTGKPYMRSMRFGKNNSWEGKGKGITHVAILEFASQEDLDYYLLQDPVHAEFSRKAAPLVEDVTVIDIQDGVLFGPTPQKPIGLGGLYKGSCHCQICEWEVQAPEGETLKHVLCHCDTCKRLGGGPYSCNYIIPHGSLRMTKGSPSVYTYKGASGES